MLFTHTHNTLPINVPSAMVHFVNADRAGNLLGREKRAPAPTVIYAVVHFMSKSIDDYTTPPHRQNIFERHAIQRSCVVREHTVRRCGKWVKNLLSDKRVIYTRPYVYKCIGNFNAISFPLVVTRHLLNITSPVRTRTPRICISITLVWRRRFVKINKCIKKTSNENISEHWKKADAASVRFIVLTCDLEITFVRHTTCYERFKMVQKYGRRKLKFTNGFFLQIIHHPFELCNYSDIRNARDWSFLL